MAVAEQTEPPAVLTPAPRRKRSFRPHYPGWLTAPSLLYYAIFFLGPMAILVTFSLATQRGFGGLSYGFDISQYKLIGNSLYTTIFERTLVMASVGSLLTIAVGYPVAYWMARYLSTYKLLALLLIVVPFWTSFLIRTYALKIILDPNGYLAKDLGISLAALTGSGPDGSITRDDVQRAAAADTPVRSADSGNGSRTATAAAPLQVPGGEERIPVRGVRKHMAAAMVSSAFTAPHVTEFLQVDVTETMAAVRRLRELPEFAELRVSPLLFVARALLVHPRHLPCRVVAAIAAERPVTAAPATGS